MTIRRFPWAIYIVEIPRGEILVTDRPSMGDDLKFKHPFSCLLSGTRGSGKTSFCIRFLLNLKSLCSVPDFSGGIVWWYCEISAIPYQQLAGHFRFHEGVPADFISSGEKPFLIILDDLLNSAYSKDCVTYLRKAAIIGILV